MDETHIKTEATLALGRLRSRVSNAVEEHTALLIMRNACDAIDKGEDGARAVKALLELWRELKFKDINADSISDLSTIVDEMYQKNLSQS
jgi:hypothetical protein